MDAGWIKAHRAMLRHPLLQRADVLGVWMRLLLMAAHEPVRVMYRGKTIQLERGQAAVSVHALADELGLTHKRLRIILGRMVSENSLRLGQSEGKAFTLVTICNYDLYQAPQESEGKGSGKAKGKRGAKEGQTEQAPESLLTTSQAKESSVPSERPSGAPSKRVVFNEILSAAGGEKRRSLVGKWVSDYGIGAVYEVHVEAMSKDVVSYVDWMVKALAKHGKRKTGPPSPADIEAEAMRILNSRNGQTDEPDEEAAADYGGADEAPRRYEAAGQFH